MGANSQHLHTPSQSGGSNCQHQQGSSQTDGSDHQHLNTPSQSGGSNSQHLQGPSQSGRSNSQHLQAPSCVGGSDCQHLQAHTLPEVTDRSQIEESQTISFVTCDRTSTSWVSLVCLPEQFGLFTFFCNLAYLMLKNG